MSLTAPFLINLASDLEDSSPPILTNMQTSNIQRIINMILMKALLKQTTVLMLVWRMDVLMPRLRHYYQRRFTCSKIPCLEIPVCLWAKIGIFLRKIISVTKQEEVACDVVAEYPSYCMIYCRRSSRKVVIMSYNISNLILTGCRTIIWIFRFFVLLLALL